MYAELMGNHKKLRIKSHSDNTLMTLAGILFDEVAIMPESFVNQATGRLSVDGAKAWFNCNPQGPMHWFKTEYIDKAKEKGLLYLHFVMDDNLSLSEERKAFYRAQYSGLFFQRYILGLWKMAEGTIYDMFHEKLNTYEKYEDVIDPDKPIRRYYAMDYGTINPCVVLEFISQENRWFVESEYYYNSKVGTKLTGPRQKDDAEYIADILEFIDGKDYISFIVDPSAASFKVSARRAGIRIKDADNDVLNGIRLVSSMLSLRYLRVNKNRCPNTIKEFGAYVWDSKAAERGEEKPLKENDHAMDVVKYLCLTVIRIIPGVRR